MYNKDYYEKNKELFLESQRKYRLKNKNIIALKRKKYDKKLEERYMICYCSTHHRQFHRMRGDSYSEMIKTDYPNPDLELYSVSGRD